MAYTGEMTGLRNRPQLVGVGTDQVRQHVRVSGIAFSRHPVTVPVVRRLERVDREHLVAGGDERPRPRPPVSLDTYEHLDLIAAVDPLADHRVQAGDPRESLG